MSRERERERRRRQRDAANRVIDDAVAVLIASSSKATVTAIGLSVRLPLWLKQLSYTDIELHGIIF